MSRRSGLQPTHGLERLVLVLSDEVGHAAAARVHVGSAELFGRHVFARHLLHDPGAGQEGAARGCHHSAVAGRPGRTQALARAHELFTQALAVEPGITEARIHRGRIAWLRGRLEESARDPERAVEEAREPLLVYLAALFLGGTREALHDLNGARVAYERAARLYPLAQSARIALSRLASRQGDRAGALRHAQQLLSIPADHPVAAIRCGYTRWAGPACGRAAGRTAPRDQGGARAVTIRLPIVVLVVAMRASASSPAAPSSRARCSSRSRSAVGR